jgi:hypothetical protein
MASRKDVLLVQIVCALTQGCGAVAIEDDAADWFHSRYYDWIDTPKMNAKAGGKKPQDVWATEGKAFLGHFTAMGKEAASGATTVTMEALSKSALAIEAKNECPWCPNQ